MFNLFLVILPIVLLAGCGSGVPKASDSPPTQVLVKTFVYRDGMRCQEVVRPLFRQLGYQCICKDHSDSYGIRSRKPGYTTECQDPAAWAINQDRIKAEWARAEAERKRWNDERAKELEIKWEREARERAEFVKRVGPLLRPYCLALERRKITITRACDTAGNPAYCRNSREQTEPLPSLPRTLGTIDHEVARGVCSDERFDVNPR